MHIKLPKISELAESWTIFETVKARRDKVSIQQLVEEPLLDFRVNADGEPTINHIWLLMPHSWFTEEEYTRLAELGWTTALDATWKLELDTRESRMYFLPKD